MKTPQEVAAVIIKGPEEANLEANVDGDSTEQKMYQEKISDIETNRMASWSDMTIIKSNLWKKLHGAHGALKETATNLAQVIASKA